ncbi:TetR family transcriptional regulator [Actinopolymorpha sp. B17G11]|uniref:TetR/AcrR family transcriptional regulator n=1 Tax=Actinopolymorpha sp. B17G11 TaxID=3160861 RepID=UPI0032E47616
MAASATVRGREVRGRLLAAAAELIVEVGWSGVSTRMLAERAGVAPGLVHYHFASVQALLSRAALDSMHGVMEEFRTLLEDASTPEAALEVILSALDGYSGRDPMSLLFVESFLAATRDEALHTALAAVVADFRELLARRFARLGVAAPDQTAAVVAAAVDGLVLHRALSPGTSAATVTPVLARLLTPARRQQRGNGKDRASR